VLFDALFAVEVLERDGQSVVVHGVKDRLGPHLAKRQVDAERQKKHRKKIEESIGRHGGVTRDVTHESRGNKDKDITTTHTLAAPDFRKAGADAAAAITADTSTAPLTDLVVKALRAAGKSPAHPAYQSRASVEAAIESVGVENATARILPAWNNAKPWLTFYLEAITGQVKANRRKGMAPPSTDFTSPEATTL
jgi:hypothetical protein